MRFIVSVLVILSLPLALAARRWTVDDVLMAESAGSFELARDGKQVVWVRSAMDKKKNGSVSHVILRHLEADWEVQLTRGKDKNSTPRFSPNGQRIAFLSNRKPSESEEKEEEEENKKPSTQVWLLDLRGGEPRLLTKFEKGVEDVHWLDDDTLLITATEDPSSYDQANKRRKDTSVVVDDEEHAPPVRLFRHEIKGKKTKRLTSNTDRITNTAVSWDGRWAVTVHERSLRWTYDQSVRPVTFLHDLEKGTATQLFTAGKLLLSRIRWALDGQGFYFSAPYTTHPTYFFAEVMRLYYYDLAAGKESRVPLDWDRGLAGQFAATPTGFVALLANGVRRRAALYERSGDGWTRRWMEGEHAENIFDLLVTSDAGKVLYAHSTASKPEQWYQAELGGAALRNARPITKLNKDFEKKPVAKREIVHWKGARDDDVEGLLYYPHEYTEGAKHPLVLMIHGGPHGVDLDRFTETWSRPINLLAARGAFILRVNYHGSSGYGLEWSESIAGGNYNDLEWVDAERGVDAMIARGLADPDQLGVMGWSNGSIITIEITTRTTRYKVASAGAGDVNWVSDWGNCKFGHSFDHYYLGKTPLEDPEFYIDKSALFRMDKVRTPTIIFFGTEDTNVPTEQGWQHFRALQQLGKTDVRFILFPGEQHSPLKLGHRRRKMTEELAWFDKHLFKGGAPENESLKPESPLSAALRRNTAGKTPETVHRNGIEIGRFEVTRAQFAAFRPSYS
ncbi:MAG: S9 family peptidase, partial [bacterium]|nr:S9 family peptidase [bacterium]